MRLEERRLLEDRKKRPLGLGEAASFNLSSGEKQAGSWPDWLPAKAFIAATGGEVPIKTAAVNHHRVNAARAAQIPVAGDPVAIGHVAIGPNVSWSGAWRNVCHRPANPESKLSC